MYTRTVDSKDTSLPCLGGMLLWKAVTYFEETSFVFCVCCFFLGGGMFWGFLCFMFGGGVFCGVFVFSVLGGGVFCFCDSINQMSVKLSRNTHEQYIMRYSYPFLKCW